MSVHSTRQHACSQMVNLIIGKVREDSHHQNKIVNIKQKIESKKEELNNVKVTYMNPELIKENCTLFLYTDRFLHTVQNSAVPKKQWLCNFVGRIH